MFYSKKTARIVACFFLSILLSITQVLATVTDQDSSSFITSNQIKLEPDYHTGSFVYSYPLTIPPGRNKLQPHLSLNYNSGNKDNSSLVGYGWALSLPYIERIARYGSDDLYTKHVFTSSLSGELEDVELTTDPYGAYGAKVDDGSFLKYEYNDDETWTVTDKKGVVYTFGSSDDDRVSDPDDTTHVFRWMLSKIEDPDGNTVTYSYTKDENQVYPSSINYTGHDSESGIFDIVFTLEARSDTQTSFATGFEVKTNYRISNMDVQVSGSSVRSYTLSYTTGDNGVRSLLESITETGTDEEGTSLTKPSTTFDYTTSERTWTEDEDFADFPLVIAGTSHGSMGVYLFDVNGDNLPDVVHSRSGKDREVYINNGDKTWTLDSNYSVPFDFAGSSGQDRGVRILDLNGDGYQDLVKSRSTSTSTESAIYINNADGTGWTEDTSITVPFTFTNGSSDFGVRIFDVDGDGMQDLVKARGIDSSDYVYINNGDGTGWTLDTQYTVPVKFTTTSLDKGVRVLDVNGDGLADLVYGRYLSGGGSDSSVYINNGDGTGWTEDTNYTVPEMFRTSGGSDMGVRPIDVNGDGLVDMAYARYLTSTSKQYDALYVNNGDGTGWNEDADAIFAMWFTGNGDDWGVREEDVNGDGLVDILYSRETTISTYEQLWVADGGHSDLLNSITHSLGATTSVTYESKVEQGGKLFFPMQVVSTITTDDGLGNTSTTTYDFSDADYYYASQYDRKFSGFGKVTITDAVGNIKIEYYHQGNDTNSDDGESTDDISKIWKPYRVEIYDSTSHLYQTIIYTWASADLGDDRSFVYESQKLELLYDGDDDHTDKAVGYTYDEDTGNLTLEEQYGDGVGDDEGNFSDSDSTDNIITTYTYAESSDGNYFSFPTSKTITDGSGTTYQETKWYYDDLDFGLANLGHVTQESKWVSGATYLNTTFDYDAYGFRTQVTDPKGYTATFTPDTYEMYPAEEVNPLLMSTSYTYDYSCGLVKEKTDSNGSVFTTTYDAFDRPTEVYKPDSEDATTSVVVMSLVYDDTSVPSSVQKTEWFTSSISRETYIYNDGFGREIQNRKEAEGGLYTVSVIIYDELGRPDEKSLPYNESGSSYASPSTTTALYTTFTYDVLGRPTATTNVKGTISQSYEARVTTETDRNNKTKTYTYDAFNRLTQVGEQSGPSVTFTTTYAWDTVGRLTKITDAENNVRSFTYDGAGNRLTAEDLHRSTDTEFGTWTYTYDDNGNLETSLSPNGITTTYTHDEMNRPLTEDADSTTATDISYEYDTCDYGKGQLCVAIVDGGATTTYSYNPLGQVSEEEQLISGTSYTTSYTYNRQNQISSLTYPDGSQATYVFGDAGHICEAKFTDIDGTTSTVAGSIQYAPTEKVASLTYGNSVVSTYSYNSTDLYRLSHATTKRSSTVLEDFTYGYDPSGNMTRLVDASSLYAGMTIDYQYDDLHRLIGATSTSSSTALTYTKNWNYGAIGNILSSTDSGTYSYNGFTTGNYANPHASTTVGSISQTYDRNGNLTVNGLWNNTWNYKNQLTQSVNGTSTLTYTYDYNGKRVYQSSTSGRISIYPNQYYDVEAVAVTRHVPFGDFGIIASSRKPSTGSAQMVFHHKDHLGGTHVDTDAGGNVVEYIVYKPFGDILLDTKTGGYENKHKFTGKEKDTETGWYYFDARYYAGSVGQFLSEDPEFIELGVINDPNPLNLKDPQGLNSYSYARNNPLRLLDPDGRSFLDRLNSVNETINTIGDILTFGAFSQTFDSVGAAGERMAQEGVNTSTVANVVVEVVSGTVTVGASALSTGIAAGEIYAGAAGIVAFNTPKITEPYKRPTNATTPAQRAVVQGQPCVNCGTAAPTMYADHKTPLVQEYYQTGKINLERMQSVGAVQPQCPSCSNAQGGQLSQYSQEMKKSLGL